MLQIHYVLYCKLKSIIRPIKGNKINFVSNAGCTLVMSGLVYIMSIDATNRATRTFCNFLAFHVTLQNRHFGTNNFYFEPKLELLGTVGMI